jgi:hypothetical protein
VFAFWEFRLSALSEAPFNCQFFPVWLLIYGSTGKSCKTLVAIVRKLGPSEQFVRQVQVVQSLRSEDRLSQDLGS